MSLITNSAHFLHLLILVDLQQARHMGMVQGQVDLHLPSFFVVFRARRCNGGSDSLRRYLALSMDIYGFFLWIYHKKYGHYINCHVYHGFCICSRMFCWDSGTFEEFLRGE